MKRHGRKPNPNRPDGATLTAAIETMTAKEIGDKYGVCESTIWRWLREYREAVEVKAEYNAGNEDSRLNSCANCTKLNR